MVLNPPLVSRRAAQGTHEGGGEEARLLCGYFLLAKQEKVTGRQAAPGEVQAPQHLTPPAVN